MRQVDHKKQNKILLIAIISILSVCIIASSALFAVFFTDSGVKPSVEAQSQNVILLIGDGMGAEHIKAGKLYEGGLLSFEKFSMQGEVITRSLTPPYTDSAASATTYATGVKTYNHRLSYKDGKSMTTIAEQAKANGKKVGIVATKVVTDATPAAFLTHVKDRNMTEEIASQIAAADFDVLIGLRNDELRAVESAFSTADCTYADSFEGIAAATTPKLVGLMDDPIPTIGANTLSYLTERALDILSRDNDNGFFLMVEGSKIDSYSHDNDMENMLRELRSFNNAVAVARSWAQKHGNTTVIVVADHETGKLKIPDGATYDELIDYDNSDKWFHATHHTDANVRYFMYSIGSEPIYGEVPTGEYDEESNPITENAIVGYKEITFKGFPKRIDNTDVNYLMKQLLQLN